MDQAGLNVRHGKHIMGYTTNEYFRRYAEQFGILKSAKVNAKESIRLSDYFMQALA